MRRWRTLMIRGLGMLAATLLAGCAIFPARQGTDTGLSGDTIALLGEVHDNPHGHRERLDLLTRAVAAGWRPAIAMEQFDTERQADIDRARREAPHDVQHVIDVATPARSNWDWAQYRPVIALALAYDLPLLAANLSGAQTTKVVRGGYASAFGADQLAALGLAQPIDAAWQAAQESEIDAGHCGMLPASVWPAMARAQLARDAVMASVLRGQGANGIVLLAGNGHVRRDIGVARWLTPGEQARVVAIGVLEFPGPNLPDAAFDAVMRVPPAPRDDPCEAFVGRGKP